MRTSLGQRCAVGVAVGIALGVIGARFVFVGSWRCLIPWTIAGAALGAWVPRARDAAPVGGCYGFALSFSFMIAGYSGAASLASRLLPFAIIGAVGAVCGAALTTMSALIVRRRPAR